MAFRIAPENLGIFIGYVVVLAITKPSIKSPHRMEFRSPLQLRSQVR